jgi:hypothetical protein
VLTRLDYTISTVLKRILESYMYNYFVTMDYHSMSLVELKQAAKNHVPKIKQYYIKSRHELIEILTMKEFPEYMKLQKIKLDELRKTAQARGYKNIWKLRRIELLELLYPSTYKNHQNHNNGQKHNHPQKGESK